MSTLLIVVALIAVFVIIAAVFLYAGPGRGTGRSGLKRRFGPEYDRVAARHGGDTKAAERELGERLQRHGGLRPNPLSAERREQYVARWAGLQEGFVDSPGQAVVEADRLLARLAEDRGYPAGSRLDDQFDALSVHHARQVEGYRRVHQHATALSTSPSTREDSGAPGGTGVSTEELREVMVGARELFEELITTRPEWGGGRPGRGNAGRNRNFSLRPKGSGA
ncbi:hypothetical protein GCM10009654_28970 [Streptomyces hebeiensis]|uniref:Secreted protein n=1 Tax=Streptomyces hebeiensis TaxID=229486 RepID=A0ABP4FDY0_9ACTN